LELAYFINDFAVVTASRRWAAMGLIPAYGLTNVERWRISENHGYMVSEGWQNAKFITNPLLAWCR
jgi:hypothetical protein